jgi:hypothetical protein
LKADIGAPWIMSKIAHVETGRGSHPPGRLKTYHPMVTPALNAVEPRLLKFVAMPAFTAALLQGQITTERGDTQIAAATSVQRSSQSSSN